MVSGNHHHGDSRFCDFQQGPECLIDQGGDDSRSMENVTPVNHEINFPGLCRCQSPFMVGQEVMPPPSAVNPGPSRKVETQMGVGQQ